MISGSSTNNQPSLIQDPALTGTLLGAFIFAVEKVLQGLSNRLPASIIAYDRSTNRAQVEILIPMVTTNGSVVSRAQIASVPVQIDGGGGVFISFPLITGDLGWIEANDRDISLFLQTYTQTKPNTFRRWSFSDAKFTPDQMKGFIINFIDRDAAVISTVDGTVRIAISPAGVNITSPVMLFTGNLHVSGTISASGTITPSTPP